VSGWLIQRDRDVPRHNRFLGQRELAVLEGLFVTRRRADWRLGRWTAKQALAAQLGYHGPLGRLEILAAEDGAPEAHLDGEPLPLSISLSHRAGAGACVVGSGPLGCDLERVEPRTVGLMETFFTAGERELVGAAAAHRRELTAALIWSAKESLLKALRTGLRRDTRGVELLSVDGPGRVQWSGLLLRDLERGSRHRGWWRQEGALVLTVVPLTGTWQPWPGRWAWPGHQPAAGSPAPTGSGSISWGGPPAEG
jgi:4'-phosphopantetheinyl transferase